MAESVVWGQENVEGIDGANERCIEIPLGLAWLRLDTPGRVLDAGCALNGHLPTPYAPRVTHLSLSLNSEARPHGDDRTSYVADDLRVLDQVYLPYAFDRGVCISTLEHVGLDNTSYGGTKEDIPETQREALDCLLTVCDQLLITVPFRHDRIHHGSWRHWNAADIDYALACRPTAEVRYWHRDPDGRWRGGGQTPYPDQAEGGSVHQIAAITFV